MKGSECYFLVLNIFYISEMALYICDADGQDATPCRATTETIDEMILHQISNHISQNFTFKHPKLNEETGVFTYKTLKFKSKNHEIKKWIESGYKVTVPGRLFYSKAAFQTHFRYRK